MGIRILYIGCVDSSKELLDTLLQAHANVVGVVTKKSSSFNSDFCSLGDCAKAHGIDVAFADSINDPEIVSFIRGKSPNVIYCFGWSQLIKREILGIPPYGVIGFHPTALPMNRGRHPLIWALALGLDETASTFFKMDEGADSGAIVSQEPVKIEYQDDAASLYARITETAKRQVVAFTKQLESGTLVLRPQLLSEGNTWRKRGMEDGEINWRMSSRAIYNLVRALTHPYVGAHMRVKDLCYKVWKVEEVSDWQVRNLEPGKVLKVVNNHDFYVKAYDHVIHVLDCDPISLTEGAYL